MTNVVEDQLCFHCHAPVTAENLCEVAPECCELHEEAWWCAECMDGDDVVCKTTCADCPAKLYCEKYTCHFVDDDGVLCGAGMCRPCHEEVDQCHAHDD